MSVRDRLHRIIDDLPDERIKTLEMMLALAQADDDDEPADDADEGLDDDLRDAAEGRTISREEIRDRLNRDV